MCKVQYHKTPRLYLPYSIKQGDKVVLAKEQAHYLGTVLRQKKGAPVRLFNEEAGEFIAEIDACAKNNVVLVVTKQLRVAVPLQGAGLVFSPLLKKDRLHFLLEKATELGVAWLQPVLYQRTTQRHFNEEKANKIIIEAAEQCERLTIPLLKPLETLEGFLMKPQTGVLWACVERHQMTQENKLSFTHKDAFLIGPEGGFTPDELQLMAKCEHTCTLSLGGDILRAETAALMALSIYKTHTEGRGK